MVSRLVYEDHKMTHNVASYTDNKSFKDVSKALELKILKDARERKFSWVEAILPFHVDNSILHDICNEYTKPGTGWYYFTAKRFVKDVLIGDEIVSKPYTKFILCPTSFSKTELEHTYSLKEFKDNLWIARYNANFRNMD